MDPDSSFNLEMRIVAPKSRARWFWFNEAVDADRAHFAGMVEDVVERYPPDYGDVASLFYFCRETKVHIPIRNDQELVEMFEKNRAYRTCLLTFAYHSPSSEPPVIPSWDSESPTNAEPPPNVAAQSSGEPPSCAEPPLTPSMACPSLAEPSQATQCESVQPEYLANPNAMNEHVGVDDEALYIDLGPLHPPPPPNPQGPRVDREDVISDGGESSETDDDDDDESDSDDEVEDIDDMVRDREPENFPEADYDKKNPPMDEGTVYSDMDAFKIALASHAVTHEFNYDIEKSDTGRYRVYCSQRNDGCKWRIHAATQKDGHTVKVIC